MRNKIIEQTIDTVIDASKHSSDFRAAFKKYIKNVFDNNTSENDLKRALSLIEEEENSV